jgi:hypothetical protein
MYWCYLNMQIIQHACNYLLLSCAMQVLSDKQQPFLNESFGKWFMLRENVATEYHFWALFREPHSRTIIFALTLICCYLKPDNNEFDKQQVVFNPSVPDYLCRTHRYVFLAIAWHILCVKDKPLWYRHDIKNKSTYLSSSP